MRHCDDDAGGGSNLTVTQLSKKEEEISNNECSIFNIQLFIGFGNSTLDIGYSVFKPGLLSSPFSKGEYKGDLAA